ncbi:DUF6807 family protein [Bauldia sp.]|uniref:DUF6807 family protein n=1 Tax=Bauldia sp. TaxID=2575872 RepID=UPI003BA92D9F
MKLRLSDETADFLTDDGAHAGTYTFADPVKPSLHPLITLAGHVITLSLPHDHPHHRGVWYGLSAADINFWEERPVRPGEAVGIQTHEGFDSLTEVGASIGFVQSLVWTAEDGSLPTFREERRLACRFDATRPVFVWSWQSRLEALRDVTLIVSHWAHETADGRRINYHGLGVRFRRDFGCVFRGTTLYVDGHEMSFADALGMVPQAVTFRGTIDGFAEPPTAGLTIRQRQPYALFAVSEPFPLVCLGPSNAGEIRLAAGDVLDNVYEFDVFDGAVG